MTDKAQNEKEDGYAVDLQREASLPYHIAFEYLTVGGRLWTGNIEVNKGEDPKQVVESSLLVWKNITPNGVIEGDLSAQIYADPCRTFLLDSIIWTKTSKKHFKYLAN